VRRWTPSAAAATARGASARAGRRSWGSHRWDRLPGDRLPWRSALTGRPSARSSSRTPRRSPRGRSRSRPGSRPSLLELLAFEETFDLTGVAAAAAARPALRLLLLLLLRHVAPPDQGSAPISYLRPRLRPEEVHERGGSSAASSSPSTWARVPLSGSRIGTRWSASRPVSKISESHEAAAIASGSGRCSGHGSTPGCPPAAPSRHVRSPRRSSGARPPRRSRAGDTDLCRGERRGTGGRPIGALGPTSRGRRAPGSPGGVGWLGHPIELAMQAQ